MIAEIDASLKNLLLGELPKLSGGFGGVRLTGDSSEVNVTFAAPSAMIVEKSEKPNVTLFLHDIRENRLQREEGMERLPVKRDEESSSGEKIGKRRAPIRVNLSYLVTVSAGNLDLQRSHQLLAEIMAIFLRNSLVPVKYLAPSLKADEKTALVPLSLSVIQDDHIGMQNPATLWSALGEPLQPSIGLQVTFPFQPFETKWVRVVREAVFGVGFGSEVAGNHVRPSELHGSHASVAGVVTDIGDLAQNHEPSPLEGVTVSVISEPIPVGGRARTDALGFWSMRDIPPGKIRVRLEKPGFGSQEREAIAPPLGRPDLLEAIIVSLAPLTDQERSGATESDVSEVSMFLATQETRTVTISGLLRYSDGRPAAYVPVQLGERKTITGADGSYVFDHLLPEVAAGTPIADVPGIGCVPVSAHGAGSGVPLPQISTPLLSKGTKNAPV